MAAEAAPEGGETDTVFIDTSLDTHFATNISDSDTVSDLKRKLLVEHSQCFPAIGDIDIHCLKVKRRGNFYRLSDSMLVKSAFGTTKKNWFISVDVSRSERHGVTQNLNQGGTVVQLALPWVTDSRSVDRHDDTNVDRPSLVQGSQLIHHPKCAPFVSQRAPTIDQPTSENVHGGILEHTKEDGSSKDITSKSDSGRKLDLGAQKKRNVTTGEKKSKKRIHDMHRESSFENGSESQPVAKRKRKTERIEGSVKGSEDDKILASNTDNVECKTVTENHDEDKLERADVTLDGVVTETLNDDQFKTMPVPAKKKRIRKRKDEDNSVHDQLVTVAPSNAGENEKGIHYAKNREPNENTGDVETILEKETHQQQIASGISQKETSSAVVQEAVPQIRVASSSMRPSNGEPDEGRVDEDNVAYGVAHDGHVKGAIGSKKSISADKDKDVVDSSPQNLGSTVPACDQDGKHDEDRGLHSQTKFLETSKEGSKSKKKKKKKAKKSTATDKDESLMINVDDPTGDVSSAVPNPLFDGKVIDERNKGKETFSNTEKDESSLKKTRDDSIMYASKKDEDLILKKLEASEPTNSNRNQMHAEDENEKSSKKSETRQRIISGISQKETSSAVIQETVSQTRVVSSSMRPSEVDLSPSNDANKREDDVDGKSRNKRSSTSKTLLDVPIEEQGKTADHLQLNETHDLQGLDKQSVRKAKKSKKSSLRSSRDKDQSTELNLEPEKVKSVKHVTSLPQEISKDVVSSEVSRGRIETKGNANCQVDIPKDASHDIDFMRYFSPVEHQNELASVNKVKEAAKSEREKKPKKKRKELLGPPVENPTDLQNSESSSGRSFPNNLSNNRQLSQGKSHAAAKKASTKNTAQVENSSQRKKTLNTPGAIFGDGSDGSSADDNGNVNSDASTRAPSDRSSESESESESEWEAPSSLDSRKNGSSAPKREVGAEKDIRNSQNRLKNISMKDVLRSSSIFKKARVAATQQMQDTESQPVDFVPESQP